MVHRRLVSCVGLLACAAVIACDDARNIVSPGDAQYRPPPPMTSSVEGTVRVVGGGALAGATVTMSGAVDSAVAQTVSDRDGHYALPSLQAGSATRIGVTGLPGYVSGSYAVPTARTADQVTRIDINVQPELRLADHMEFDLSNDDIAYGDDTYARPRLWPVKIIQIGKPMPGATILAEWSGNAQIAMWLEDYDTTMSRPTLVPSTAVLTTSVVYYSNQGTLRVGQLASLGGLRAPVHVRLTVRPAGAPAS